jgi:hypothetical protein
VIDSLCVLLLGLGCVSFCQGIVVSEPACHNTEPDISWNTKIGQNHVHRDDVKKKKFYFFELALKIHSLCSVCTACSCFDYLKRSTACRI